MRRKAGIIAVVIVVLIAIGGLIGYRMYNKPHADVNEAEAITVTAEAIYKEFETDESTANLKYTGENKVVQVSGTVGEITQQDTLTYVTLAVPDAMGGVMILTDKSASAAASNLKPGDQVTLKGFCNGYLMPDVKINGGVIVSQ